jgi:hypothetical protein
MGREVKRTEACFGADSTLLAALAGAADATRADDGSVKTRALPKLFKDFSPTAWKDMIACVPDEEHGDEIIEPAQEEFTAKLGAALNRIVALGRVYEDGGETHTVTENRSLLHWCGIWGKPGQWGQIRSFCLWARRNEQSQLEIALHSILFAQIGMGDLAKLSVKKFAHLCRLYGVGAASDNCRPKGLRAILLSREFIEQLLSRPDVGDCRTDSAYAHAREKAEKESAREEEEPCAANI